MTNLADMLGPDMEPPDDAPGCCRCDGKHLHEADEPKITKTLRILQDPLDALRLLCDQLDGMNNNLYVGLPRKNIAAELTQIFTWLEADEARLREIADEIQYCEKEILCASCAED